MKVLFWKNDGKPNFSGKSFEIFKVSWDKRRRIWVRNNYGRKWGLNHPVTGRIVGLRKDPKAYGVVEEFVATVGSDKMGITMPKVEMGTPTLGVVENDEEE